MASAAIEDYLKTIYAHTEWQDDPITPSVLAAKLGIAPSSVTQMVSKLVDAGLIERVPYGPLTLTEAGRTRAMDVVRRHRLIETWLVQDMGYTWDAVHDEAEVIEHVISERLLAAIDARLDHPERDPHGDPIPAADGRVPHDTAKPLAEAAAGESGTVARVDDKDPAVLRELTARGLQIGSTVTVTATTESGVVLHTPAGADASLDATAIRAVWMRVEKADEKERA